MIPVLHNEQYHGEGTIYNIGLLPSWVECLVTEERNGEFFLEGTLPVGAPLVNELDIDRIISAAPAPGKPMQPFRINKITKEADGSAIHITAHHVSYQLNNVILGPHFMYYYSDIDALLNEMTAHATPSLTNEFTFSSNITLANAVNFSPGEPKSVRNWIGGDGGLLEKLKANGYDAEITWDGWSVSINVVRGTATDLAVAYAHNLESLALDKDSASLITAYYGYGDWEGNYKSAVAYRTGYQGYIYPRFELVDLSNEFETVPSDSDLQDAINAYASDQGAAQLPTSITVTAIPDDLKNVYLCDSVQVIHPNYNLNKSAKIVRTVYDPIRERYTAVTIGEIRIGITDTVARMLAGGI